MKYKLGAIIVIGALLTVLIYFHTEEKKINVLALGDGITTGMTVYHVEGYDFNDYLIEYLNEKNQFGSYFRNFNETDETTASLLTKLNNNIENIDKKIKIKQAIREAEIITIALGMDELNNYAQKNLLGTTKINAFINKYEEIIKQLREVNTKKIYLIGLYSSSRIADSKIEKINNDLETLCKKYNLIFIDISNIRETKDLFTQQNNYYLNYKGQKYIFEKIKETIEKPTMKII